MKKMGKMKKNISETVKRKKGQFALLKAVTLALVAIIVVLNILLGVVGNKVNMKIDITQDGVLKFSDTTKQTLKGLETEVNVYSLVPEADTSEITVTFREIIEKYAKLSGKINYSVVDANKNPAFINKYIELGESLTQYTVIFETDKRYKTVDLYDALIYDSTGQSVTSLKAEQLFTSALMYVTTENETKLGVITGHGEVAAVDYFEEILNGEGIVPQEVNLLSGEIAEDINTLVITTPQTDYTIEEIDAIDAFLDKGNSLQVMIDVNNADLTNIYSYLKEWGVEYMNGFMLENDANYYYQTPIYLLPEVMNTDATQAISSGGLRIIAASFRAIAPCKNTSVIETPLLKTSKTSLLKANLQTQTTEKEDGDIEGEQIIAAMYEREANDGKSAKLLVTGGTSIIAYDLLNTAFANKDFYFNIISDMSGNDTGFYIRAKDISSPNIVMPALSGIIYAAVTVILIPLILIIAGIVIWIKRRHL